MLKKLPAVAVLSMFAVLFAIPAFADNHLSPGGTDGCGLGWQVTDKKTMLGTTTRGTTNSVVAPSFGMTSGTLGCEQHGFASVDQRAEEYTASNFEPLRMEMAEGNGEHLAALARTFGCSDNVQADFGRMTQENYRYFLEGFKSTPANLVRRIRSRLREDEALSNNCDQA